MKSTEGRYFSKLDHIRAFAAYQVFVGHFIHLTDVYPVPYGPTPFPFAIFEGGTGVALFMALSGYLFAKLVGTNRLIYTNFLWSRAVRLLPLLLVVIVAWYPYYRFPIREILKGVIFPTLPGGAWSITVEAHFYLVFPLLLMAVRRFGPRALIAVLIAAILFRAGLWYHFGKVEYLAYWTIVGRIDQFLLGMFFCFVPINAKARAWTAAIAGLAFLIFWQWRPTGEVSGIFNPTMQALGYAAFIRWYDDSPLKLPYKFDRAFAHIGEWSYSIYLLHFFFRVALIWVVGDMIGSAENFWPSLAFATLCFVAFLPIPALSYIYFETWFLQFRLPYLVTSRQPSN